MDKQGKKDLLNKLKDTLALLNKQQEQAKQTWERCQGAIEVIEQLVSEEENEQKS